MSLNEALCREVAAILSELPSSVPSKPSSPLEKRNSQEKKASIFATTWNLHSHDGRPPTAELKTCAENLNANATEIPTVLEAPEKFPENDNGDNLSDSALNLSLSLNLEGDASVNNGVTKDSEHSLNMLRLFSSTQVPVAGQFAEGIVPGHDRSDLYSMAGPPSTADSLHGLDHPNFNVKRNQSIHVNLEENSGGKTTSHSFLNDKTAGSGSSTASSRASSRIFLRDSKSSQRNSSEGINAILQDSSRTSVGSTHRSSLRGPRCAHDYANIVAQAEASKMDEIPAAPFPYEKFIDRDDAENNNRTNNNNNNNTSSRKSVVSFTPILRESCSRTPETISKSFLQSVNDQIQNIKLNQARERDQILAAGQLQNQNPTKNVYPYQGQYPCIHQNQILPQIPTESACSLSNVPAGGDKLAVPKNMNFHQFTFPMEIETQTLNQDQSHFQYSRPKVTSTGTNKTIIIDQNIRNKVKAEFSIQTENSSPVPWGQMSSMDSQMAILALNQKLLGCYPVDAEPPLVVDDGRIVSREFAKRRLAPRRTSSFFGRFLNFNDALSITNYSLQAAWNTADEIFRSYVIPPELEETLEATCEEMEEADDVVAVSILRLLGLPIEARYAIYKEVLEELQVLNDFSLGTIQIMTNLIDWLCTGNHDTADLVAKTRLFATSQTELDPDSEGWKQFERDICIFSRAVASSVHTAARAVSRQCSHSTECLASRFRATRFPIEESKSPQPQTPVTPISPPFTPKSQSQPLSSTSINSNSAAQVIAGQVTESEFEFRPISALTRTDSQGSRASFQSNQSQSNKSRIPIPVKSSGNFNSTSSNSGNNNNNNSREILKPEENVDRNINLGMLRDALENKNQEKSPPGRRHLSVSEFSQIPNPSGPCKTRPRQAPQKQRKLESAGSNGSDDIENDESPSISSMSTTISTEVDNSEKESAADRTEFEQGTSSRGSNVKTGSNFKLKSMKNSQKSHAQFSNASSVASALFTQAASYIPSFDDTFGPQVDQELKFPESNPKESNWNVEDAEDESFFNSLQRAVETASSIIFGAKQTQNYYQHGPNPAVRSTTPTQQSFGSIIRVSRPQETTLNSQHSSSNTRTSSPSVDSRSSDLSHLTGQQSYYTKIQEGQSGQSTPDENDTELEDDENWPNFVKIQEAERAIARQSKKSSGQIDPNQGQNQKGESLTVQLSKACLNNLYHSLKDAIPAPLITMNADNISKDSNSEPGPASGLGQQGHSKSHLNHFPDVSASRILRTNSGHAYYLNSRRSSSTSQVTDAASETGISAVPSITSQMMIKVPKNSNVGFTQAIAEQSMRDEISYLEEILKTLKESASFCESPSANLNPSTNRKNSRSRPKNSNSNSNSSSRTPSVYNTTNTNTNANVNNSKNVKNFGPAQSRIPMKKMGVAVQKISGQGNKKPNFNRNSEKPSSISLNQSGRNGMLLQVQPQSLSSSKILRNEANMPTHHRQPRIIHTPTASKAIPMKAKLQIIQAVPTQRAPYQVQLNRNYQYSKQPTNTNTNSGTFDPHANSQGQGQGQPRSTSRSGNSYRELMLRKNQTVQNPVQLGGRSRTTGGSYSRRHEMAEAANLHNKTSSNLSYRGQRSNSRTKGPMYKYDDGTHEQTSSFNSSKCSSTESSSRNLSNTPSSNNLSSNNHQNIHPTRPNPRTVLEHEVESNYQNYHGGSGTPLFRPPNSDESSSGSSRQPSLFFPSLESTGFLKPFANLTQSMNKVFSVHSQPKENIDNNMGHSH